MLPTRSDRACPACGATGWIRLPDPHPGRSMLSDLRVIDAPLNKWMCDRCALVHRRASLPPDVFESEYELYAHSPGASREHARQAAYASWIASHSNAAPRTVLDVGCGNGSLLLACRQHWPLATLRGVDPSRKSTNYARASGIDADAQTLDGCRAFADLVMSVNVVEHTEDPAAFLRELADSVVEAGELVVICPDGGHAWTEMLMADHRWSLRPAHIATWLGTSGINVTFTGAAPAALGPFAMIRGVRTRMPHSAAVAESITAPLERERRQYLEQWRRLDRILEERSSLEPLICFGIGEAAGLLRAYAPNTWARVSRCVADRPESDVFGSLPVHDYATLAEPATVLLGVRPQDQSVVAARLQADGHRVVRWDDVVEA